MISNAANCLELLFAQLTKHFLLFLFFYFASSKRRVSETNKAKGSAQKTMVFLYNVQQPRQLPLEFEAASGNHRHYLASTTHDK